MKLNWGIALATIYVGFMILMLGVVYKSRQHDVNLVASDYFEQELNYQEEIDAQTNANHLAEKVTVDYTGGKIHIQLSDFGPSANGQVVLFRPSDRHLDQIFPLKVSEDSKMIIPTDHLKKGLWDVKIKWESAGKKYQYKHSVFL
ncbi:MAG TPA: hypothetical protein ENK85_02935 [Saprospiraceae bacterium]|nr:hypothetical protein [Saprospiraceae bacterium]